MNYQNTEKQAELLRVAMEHLDLDSIEARNSIFAALNAAYSAGQVSAWNNAGIKTSGPFRVIRRVDGYFVVGHGTLTPAETYADANSIIKKKNLEMATNNANRFYAPKLEA